MGYRIKDLDDHTLRALGRVVWDAINVEDRAIRLAEEVLTRDAGRTPAGVMVKDAIAAVERWTPAEDVSDALSWLQRVGDALVRRNAVMHGIPSGTYPEGEPVLVYMHRDSEAITRTPLTAATLDSLADDLERLHREWVDLLLVIEQRGVRWDRG